MANEYLSEVIGRKDDEDLLGLNLETLYGLAENDTSTTIEGLSRNELIGTFQVGDSKNEEIFGLNDFALLDFFSAPSATFDENILHIDSRAAISETQDTPDNNFRLVVGGEANDDILGSDIEILYGLEGNDTLAPIEGSLMDFSENILVGGSGDDRYQLSQKSDTMIIEHGNTDDDVLQATGIELGESTSFSMEIDNNRHLYIGDIESNQYALLVDWQVSENLIERFEFTDSTQSYREVAENFRSYPNYLGSYTWEELGGSSTIFDENLALINFAAEILEAQDPITGEIVYRFFAPSGGKHLYTTDTNERDYIINHLHNYSFEQASYKAADPLTGDSVPVYRFLNSDTSVHLYTTDENEKEYIIDNLDHFVFEGEKFLAYQEDIGQTIPIYRFYEPNLGVHFYTPSEAEKDFVETNLPNYSYEGIAYYANPIDIV